MYMRYLWARTPQVMDRCGTPGRYQIQATRRESNLGVSQAVGRTGGRPRLHAYRGAAGCARAINVRIRE